jgi:hypothetical protein
MSILINRYEYTALDPRQFLRALGCILPPSRIKRWDNYAWCLICGSTHLIASCKLGMGLPSKQNCARPLIAFRGDSIT